MTPRWLLAAAALVAAVTALPARAEAQTLAYAASGYTNLREGPSTRYQIIARVAGGSQVHVDGCLDDRSWCFVRVSNVAGWMAASRLLFSYAGNYVYVPDYYRYFNAPVINFGFGYHSRPRPWWHHGGNNRDEPRPSDGSGWSGDPGDGGWVGGGGGDGGVDIVVPGEGPPSDGGGGGGSGWDGGGGGGGGSGWDGGGGGGGSGGWDSACPPDNPNC